MIPSNATTQASPRIGAPAEPETGGAGPLRVAMVLSAVRCTLTYVVAPALTSVAVVDLLIGPIAIWLHLFAVGSLTYGTVRMWRGCRPWRVPYTALALFVALLSIVGLVAS